MGMGRAKVTSALPETVYVVSFGGSSHKLYSKLSTARGVRTNYLNYHSRIDPSTVKIIELDVTAGVEVDG